MAYRILENRAVSIINSVIKLFSYVSSFLLCAMVLVVVFNVAGRFLFKWPLYGTIELVELMMIIICFLAMAYTSFQRGHVRITLVVNRLPKKVQEILDKTVSFLNAGIFSIIVYQAVINAVYYANHLDQRTDTLEIPVAPFKAVMVFGLGMLSIVELMHFFRPLPPEQNQ